MKMINKYTNKAFLLTVMTLVFVTSLVMAIGTSTVNVPVVDNNYSSSITLNCTTTVNSATNLSNVTFYRSTSGGGEANTTSIAIVANTSASQSEYTYVYDISSLTDSSSYNVTCAGNNGTDKEFADGISPVTFDSTSPTTSITRGRSPIEPGTSIKLECSCSDGIDSSVVATRTITQPDDTNVSVSITPYTGKGSDTNILGKYTWTCACQDASTNTASDTKTFRVDTEEDGVTTTTPGTTSILRSAKGNKITIMVIISMLVGIGVIGTAVYMLNKK